jgi:hypothetical protein
MSPVCTGHGSQPGVGGLQNRPYYLAERDRGVDLAVCDGLQPRFDFLKVCQEPAVLLG